MTRDNPPDAGPAAGDPAQPQPRSARQRWHAAHRRWRHSIKWRLLTVFVLLALATAAVFLLGTQRALMAGWQGWVKPIVSDHIDRLVDEIGSPPDTARAAAITRRLPITIRIDGPSVHFDSHAEREHNERRAAWREHRDREDWGSIERRTADGHRIRFGLAPPPHDDRPRIVGWVTLGVLLLLTLVAYAVVRRLLRPLDAIGAGAMRFGAGDFDTPIPIRRRDEYGELGELAQRVNTMAHNLHGMLDAKRTLLLAISHELRSPLTRARLNAELVPEGTHRDALLRDLGEMRDLITDLLESERLSDGHRALQTESTDIGALVTEALAEHTQAHPNDPPPAFTPPATPIHANVDRARLRLLLRNLLANAARHGRSEQDGNLNIQVELTQQTNGITQLQVRDRGPGVQADQLQKLAQAFHRPDAARTRDAGGVGLGLYLCRLVAQAHGGELQISNAGPGLRVGMRWVARRD